MQVTLITVLSDDVDVVDCVVDIKEFK